MSLGAGFEQAMWLAPGSSQNHHSQLLRAVIQVLFRPMAMMIPDYQLVAEVMLFSEGFDQATWLAVKMVQLYKLASEQLSQQVGYYNIANSEEKCNMCCLSKHSSGKQGRTCV